MASCTARIGASGRGQTMTEYILILAGVAVIALAAYQALGTPLSGVVQGAVAILFPQ